jgi:O-antigen ligase
LSTLLRAPAYFHEAFLFCSATLLAFYSKHNYGKVFDYNLIRNAAIIILAAQVSVCVLQFVTFSNIGAINLYFGETASRAPTLVFQKTIQRAVGTLGHPNVLGIWFIMLTPLLFGMFSAEYRNGETNKWVERGCYVLWSLCFVILFVGNSRGNIVAMILCLLFLMLVNMKTKYGISFVDVGIFLKRSSILLLMLLLLSIVIRVPKGSVANTISNPLRRTAQMKRSIKRRMEQYQGAAISTIHHPIFGVGFKQSRYIWPRVGIEMAKNRPLRPHSVYLILSAEAGLPALILFLCFSGMPLTRYFRQILCNQTRTRIARNIFTASVMAYLVAGCIYEVSVDHSVWPLFMFMIGCLHAAVLSPYEAKRSAVQLEEA